MKKDNEFWRKVVAHYILKKNPELKNDIDQEVDKWIDHNSKEFINNIASDAFSIIHYLSGLAYMVEDCFKDEERIKIPGDDKFGC